MEIAVPFLLWVIVKEVKEKVLSDEMKVSRAGYIYVYEKATFKHHVVT